VRHKNEENQNNSRNSNKNKNKNSKLIGMPVKTLGHTAIG